MNCCVSLVPDTSNFHTASTSLFDVDVSREGYAVVMSGVDSSYNAYVHSVDPVLALNFTGENSNNTYLCRALSSLLFGEVESQVLNLSGRESNSSVSFIFSEILNGANFTLNFTDGILTIRLAGNENYTFIFDLNTGLVYDLTKYGNFTYKGAISYESNGNCPFIFAYIVVENFHEAVRYKGDLTYHGEEHKIPEYVKRNITAVLASLATATSVLFVSNVIMFWGAVPFIPGIGIPLLVAGLLIFSAYELNKYAYECDSNKAKEETIIGIITSL